MPRIWCGVWLFGMSITIPATAMTRRTRARRACQLWLTPELEYAPYASWMVPRMVKKSMLIENTSIPSRPATAVNLTLRVNPLVL
jgi:hypothetical protein